MKFFKTPQFPWPGKTMFSFSVVLLGHWKNPARAFAGSTNKQAATQLERDGD